MTRLLAVCLLASAAIGCDEKLEVLQGEALVSRDAAAPQDAGSDTGASNPCSGASCAPRVGPATIAAGVAHTCVVVNGALYCWGDNSAGQLGTGNTSASKTPAAVGSNYRDWAAVAAGSHHTCALRQGTLFCFGDNSLGQLGGIPARNRNGVRSTDTDYTDVRCGGDNCCALRQGGALYCWGSNEQGTVGVDRNGTSPVTTPAAVAPERRFLGVSVGTAHACAVDDTHALFCWGSNSDGQLGQGAAGNPIRAPAQVGTNHDWASVSCGDKHTCALSQSGRLSCWGANDAGQLGVGRDGPDVTPLQIGTPEAIDLSEDWSQVAAGGQHTCAIKSSHELRCWGSGRVGQVGAGSVQDYFDTPTAVRTSQAVGFAEVATGAAHSCAFDVQHKLYCWGDDADGQLGLGDTQERDSPAPVPLP